MQRYLYMTVHECIENNVLIWTLEEKQSYEKYKSIFYLNYNNIYKTDYNALDFTSRPGLFVWPGDIIDDRLYREPMIEKIDKKETLELVFEHGDKI